VLAEMVWEGEVQGAMLPLEAGRRFRGATWRR
jgi:hypothetical protein